MRGGAHVKEVLGVVTLLWNHPVLTGLLLLVFTPPFFPLVVYFSPLLMSTALCVVALVSVGSQMEKIKAEGGPGQQLESHLGRDHGVSRWVPPAPRRSHHDDYAHRSNLFNIDVVAPAAPGTPWHRELPVENVVAPAPAPPVEESQEDWLDNWVKEYESRPGWGEQEDQLPAIRPPATSRTAAPRSVERQQDAPPTNPRKAETREVKDSPAPAVVVSVAASVAASAAPVVSCRQEVVARSLPPPPTPTRSRNGQEKVVKESDLRPHVSLAPILTARDARKAPEGERVSDAQALQSIERLLQAESNAASDVAHARNEGEGVKSRTAKVVAVAPPAPDRLAGGSPPLLRHLKVSQAEKMAYSPLPARATASKGLMSEKVLPPPQFSPLLLQSLQPLPPKSFSPRLPNSSSVPLGNPVEKIPQWVYDGIPRERTEERAEETKNVRAFEQAVRELSESRRKKNARRPLPIQVGSQAEATLARIRKQRTPSSRVTSPAMAAVEARISEDMDAPVTAPSPTTLQASTAAPPQRPAPIAASPQRAPIAASPRASSPHPAPVVASPRPSSPQPASIAASPRPSSPHPAPIAASPRPSSPQPAPIAASPRPSSRHPAPVAASPRPSSPQPASIAASPRPSSPHPAPVAASPRPSSAGSSPQRALVAASPRRASSPRISLTPWPASTASPQKPSPSAAAPPSDDKSPAPAVPSVPHPRRRRQSSKSCTDKVAFTRIQGSTYYDPPSAAAAEEESPSEEYVPIEATPVLPADEELLPIAPESPAIEEDVAAGNSIRWGRTRKSRRRLEPRRVVTSADTDMFSLKKSFSTRSGETKKFVDSSSSSDVDNERESVTPRSSSCRRSMTKPLVWRSRSQHVQEAEAHDQDSD